MVDIKTDLLCKKGISGEVLMMGFGYDYLYDLVVCVCVCIWRQMDTYDVAKEGSGGVFLAPHVIASCG